jgi:post-segregation antitoxin (ccd killing protein)
MQAPVSVYPMRMARVNIYLPDDLAKEAKAAGLNISRVAQEALRAELSARRVSDWLDEILRLPPTRATHADIMTALREARAELWGDDA